MKKLRRVMFLGLLLGTGCLFQSCNDDNDVRKEIKEPETTYTNGVFVLNQGNFGKKIASSVSFLDYDKNEMVDSVFYKANETLVGNTLQAGIVYGSHFLAVAYESNVMIVANRRTLKIEHVVNLEHPRAITAEGNYVYVSSYDGYVSRLDTLTFLQKDTLRVGPNPEEMTVANGYLYVANSDGMNYLNGYSNGLSVSKIKLYENAPVSKTSVQGAAAFEYVKTIPVGINPGQIKSDSEGNVFVLAMGDYMTTPPTIQKINVDDEVSDVDNATYMTIVNDKLYAFYTETVYDPETWAVVSNKNTYYTIDTKTLERKDLDLGDGVLYPVAMQVDKNSGDIYLTSESQGQYGADYLNAGYMNRYKSDGTFVSAHKTGVHPVQLVFAK